jgi:hypothetical protein
VTCNRSLSCVLLSECIVSKCAFHGRLKPDNNSECLYSDIAVQTLLQAYPFCVTNTGFTGLDANISRDNPCCEMCEVNVNRERQPFFVLRAIVGMYHGQS